MSSLSIIQPGLQSSVQDAGRFGYQQIGITQSGAIDGFAYRLGQRLVGNKTPCAALELSYGGVSVRADTDCDIALTGAQSPAYIHAKTLLPTDTTLQPAPCSPRLIPHATTVRLRAGELLTIDRPDDGIYSYLSITGGVATPPLFESRSTTLREGLGGHEGRALQAGDQLPLGTVTTISECFSYPPISQPSDTSITLRLLPCFQFDDLSEDCRKYISYASFTLSSRVNRMAACLEGEPLNTGIEQLYSEATCLGAVQIPPNGQPIVLLNERQTLGGYPKAGAILSVDCARLVQRRPGTTVRFKLVTQAEANRVIWLHQNYERELRLLTTDQRRS